MQAAAATQLRWGVAVALLCAAAILVLALVPDPLGRQRVFVTRFDDVAAVDAGVPVFFRGAEIGSVRAIALEPDRRTFAVRLGLRREWQPSACSFARIAAANPLTAPRVEVVAIEGAASCPAALALAGCDPLGAPGGARPLPGCRRAPDMLETAMGAVDTMRGLVTRLAAMIPAGGKGGGMGVDVAQMAANTSATLAALSGLSARVNDSLAPGRGDVALTLANVRKATGRASEFDMASLNATVGQMQQMVAENRAAVSGLLAETRGSEGDMRALLQQLSGSLAETSANLARASANAATLSDRMSADPTFALHGARLADPPPPGGSK